FLGAFGQRNSESGWIDILLLKLAGHTLLRVAGMSNSVTLILVQRAAVGIAQLNIVIAGSKRELLGLCDLIRTNNWPTLLCNSRAIRRLSPSRWEAEPCHYITQA